ncbi:LacI family DNA-binding transcriptional regulator [Companilactobacillus furfuricola]|uniref:LacI family DNA-binding transcriptional regulator n=1 Tax=Companilactobacillus furfuricola TaxID=1462575 RepID=UPI000F769AB1|nr:LacI family DNA-binding transcriptional regulator [Companilactobacillus furfuricola]
MTNKEIAQELGISAAALSLIINHKPGVSSKTRSEVINKLIEMGYGNLIKANSANDVKSIAFVIYKRHGQILDLHPFFLLVMNKIETYARKLGYSVILFTIDERQPLVEQIGKLNELQAKGIILVATEMSIAEIKPFMQASVPIVTLDNDFTTFPINSVSIDNAMGTRQAIDYLLEKGISEIGYLRSSVRISSFQERQEGFEKAIRSFNLSIATENIYNVSYTEDGSYRDVRSLLKQGVSMPKSLVCDDDTIAVGAIRAFKEFGLRIPEDIAVIGFNNRPNSKLTEPELTTIDVPKDALAVAAIDTLVKAISAESEGSSQNTLKLRVGTKLIKRKSV